MNKNKYEHLDTPDKNLEKNAGEFWSESETNASIQDLSHWSGVGRWMDKCKWAAIGEENLDRFLKFANCENLTQYNHAVEWGPGGGSNAVSFLSHFKQFTGVDVSAPNLKECERQVKQNGLTGFYPILFDVCRPESVVDQLSGPCDLFFSTGVFQHFPSKNYGKRVLNVVKKILSLNALIIIQIRYDNGNPLYTPKKDDYENNVVVFNSYKIDEFWMMMCNEGLSVSSVKLYPETNTAYYFAKNLNIINL